MMGDIQPSSTALARAQELCEWEQIMWAVLWDTTHDRAGRLRHLCFDPREGDAAADHPVFFRTRREAEQYIRCRFAYALEPQYRAPPRNYRLPKPYRVRVRVTVPLEGDR